MSMGRAADDLDAAHGPPDELEISGHPSAPPGGSFGSVTCTSPRIETAGARSTAWPCGRNGRGDGWTARWRRSFRITDRHGVRTSFRFWPVDQAIGGSRTAPGDRVVVCLVRNSEARVTAFLDYYLRLGARHIVLVDNGSTDRTIEKACESEDRVRS